MLETIFENMKNGNFADIAGTEIKCNVPLSIPKVNLLLSSTIEDKKNIKRFEVIKIMRGIITIRVTLGNVSLLGNKLDFVDRDILVRLHPKLDAPDFELKMEVIDGVNVIENEVLELLFNTLFRNKTLDFENRILYVNHNEFSDNETYNNLLKCLVSAKLKTKKDFLQYDLHFAFTSKG